MPDTVKNNRDHENIRKETTGTCFSGSEGDYIAGVTGAQTVLGKHADVVC